ncbi:MAG: RNA-binding domain-containing protein [Candidatus Hadarchaeales archaeon]
MRVWVEAEVKPSEDPSKVERAVRNLFPSLPLERVEGKVRGGSEDPGVLSHLRDLLRLQAIRDSSRNCLLKGRGEGRLEFWLNKQAAFVGKVSFTEGEAPLGPIRVLIETKDTELVLDYLAPRTKEGRALREVSLEEVRKRA